jgi:hypothetical protein
VHRSELVAARTWLSCLRGESVQQIVALAQDSTAAKQQGAVAGAEALKSHQACKPDCDGSVVISYRFSDSFPKYSLLQNDWLTLVYVQYLAYLELRRLQAALAAMPVECNRVLHEVLHESVADTIA